MINFSFQISQTIFSNLRDIDNLRSRVLLYPIKPEKEIQIRWEANLNKIYWGLSLEGNPIPKKEIAAILNSPTKKRMTTKEKEVLGYKSSLDFIRNNWTGSNSQITTNDILKIYDLSSKNLTTTPAKSIKLKSESLSQILKYIESGNDHPIIKAGLMQIELIKLSPFEESTSGLARLISHLILSKYGYDLRGFLVIEDFYRSDLVSFRNALKSIETYKSATFWLEYFSLGIKNGMQKALNGLEEINQFRNSSLYSRLSDRLQKIINILDNPNKKITNKDVQKIFKVSQITASRDLARLTSIGVLLAHGKGRSIFYTKI